MIFDLPGDKVYHQKESAIKEMALFTIVNLAKG
jgi:hypothetical protein